MSTLRLVTAPPILPVRLADMKKHLRVDDTIDDPEINALIQAATDFTEGVTKRALVVQTWDWVLDRFPPWFAVPKPPLQSVVSIKYLDMTNTLQTLAASDAQGPIYIVDNNPDYGRVALGYARVWPWTYPVLNAVTMRFVAGYPDAGGSPTDLASGIPTSLVHALKLLVAHFYENREAVAMSRTRGGFELMPLAYQALVAPFVSTWA